MTPEDLKYTAEHEWIREGDDGVIRIGITDYAQEQLGDIVYVHLPDVGSDVEAGAPMGELESTKSVSDLFAPVSGQLVARNDNLDAVAGALQQRSVRRGLDRRDPPERPVSAGWTPECRRVRSHGNLKLEVDS